MKYLLRHLYLLGLMVLYGHRASICAKLGQLYQEILAKRDAGLNQTTKTAGYEGKIPTYKPE